MSIKIVRMLHENAMKKWDISLSESDYYDLLCSGASLFAQSGMAQVALSDILQNAGLASREAEITAQLTLQALYTEVFEFANQFCESILFPPLTIDTDILIRVGNFSEGLARFLSDYLPFAIIGFLGDFFNADSYARQQSEAFRQKWVEAIETLSDAFWQKSQLQDVSQKSLTYFLGYLSRFVLNNPDTESIEKFANRLERYWLGFGLLDSVVSIEDGQEVQS